MSNEDSTPYAELPGEQPITLSSIAKRIEDLMDIVVTKFGEMQRQQQASCQEVADLREEVADLKKKLKNCPSINPNGDAEACVL